MEESGIVATRAKNSEMSATLGESEDEIELTSPEDILMTQRQRTFSDFAQLEPSHSEDPLLGTEIRGVDDDDDTIKAGITPQRLILSSSKSRQSDSGFFTFNEEDVDDMLDEAVAESLHRMNAPDPSPKHSELEISPTFHHSQISDGNIVLDYKSRIPVRRVSSSPLHVKHRASLPHKLERRASQHEILKAPPVTKNVNLTSPYSMKRQTSLPVTAGERRPKTDGPLLQLARTNSASSLSSASSIAEEDIDRLAKELATPKKRSRSGIFRKVRIASAASRRASQSIPDDQIEPTSPPSTGKEAEIKRNDTGVTHRSEDEETGVVNVPRSQDHRLSSRYRAASTISEALQISEQSSSSHDQGFFYRTDVQNVMFLSVFAIFGATIRVYLGRFFGSDCENPDSIHDFLTPLSRRVCVTFTGRTEQRGGALFVDLPANMIGSFIMGVMANLRPTIWPPLPWLKDDHPLQRNHSYQLGIKTGLCGSLTTFASWNAEMVLMVDGTNTKLGRQVAPAIYGYILGIIASISSFLFGTHISAWLNGWRGRLQENGEDLEQHVEELHDTPAHGARTSSPPSKIVVYPTLDLRRRLQTHCTCLRDARTLPFIALFLMMVGFFVGDGVMNIPFYRSMWVSALVAPLGAHLRWWLSKWNSIQTRNRLSWVPWGTMAANLIGSVVSVLALAIQERYIANDNPWVLAFVVAVRVGFAGSLSTVSTFVKELVDLANMFPLQAKAYYYGGFTLFMSFFLSMVAYSPIVRA